MKTRTLCLLTMLIASSYGSRSAWAQSDEERAAARATAQRGISAWKEGRYAEAVDLLSRAEAVVHAPPHLLYIARAHAKQGRLVKAREFYLKLAKEQVPPQAPKAFVDAKADGAKELVQLEPRLAQVKIVIEGPSQNLRVLVDDAPVPPSLVGIAVPTDPGVHKYRATGDGAESELAEITLEEGAQRTITLTLHALAPAPATAATPLPAAPDRPPTDGGKSVAPPSDNDAAPSAHSPSPSSGHGSRFVSYVMLGAGVVALGTGAYFQNLRMRREKVSTDHFNQCDPRVCTDAEVQAILDLDARANAAQRSANIAFACGGAAIAVGVTLLILDRNASPSSGASKKDRFALQPWLSPSGGGVMGTF